MQFRSMAVSCALLVLMASSAWATNGMETTASGGRAAGMGGVDLAVATDATAINTNPAGLMQLLGHRIDVGAGLLIPSLHFKNALNDEDGATQMFPMPELAYGYRFKNVPLAVGFGLFAQGGMGADFTLTNPVLGKDTEYSSNIAYLKAAPAIAWQPLDWMSVGLALNVGYASLAMRMPYAVSPTMLAGVANPQTGMTFGQMFAAPAEQGGLGYDELVADAELQDAGAYGFGGKLGLLFMPGDMVKIGVSYTPKSTLDFTGTMTMDMSAQFADAFGRMVAGAMAQGLDQEAAMQAVGQQLGQMGIDPSKGMKAEYDADIEFAWPQKAGLGVAVTPTPALLLAADVTWINWADTMKEFKVELTGGDNDNINTLIGDDSITSAIPLDWENQIVVAVGGQYEIVKNLWGRLGYNYGRNPVPDTTVFPVFPAIVEHHATLGVGYRHEFFEVNAAYEHAFANTQKAAADHDVASEYNDSESTLGESTAHLMLSFSF